MNPFQVFFVLLIVVPIIEIYLLIQVGSVLGAIPTILLIIVTAVLGAMLIRIQGFSTWQRLQTTLAKHEIPAIEILESIMILISGALLLTPGFFTDTIGFICLIPSLRQRFAIHLLQSGIISHSHTEFTQHEHPKSHEDDFIEGEFKRDEEDPNHKKLP